MTRPRLRRSPPESAANGHSANTDSETQPANRSATSSLEPTPAEVVEQPVPAACDQLVLRNGELIDVNILVVGVDEIRYRKCHREDGPEYVISKHDVLSIRYANGDIDRICFARPGKLVNEIA